MTATPRNRLAGRRAGLAAQAIALRAEGLSYPTIAERLGISRSYANSLVTDPDAAKNDARKRSYRGACEDCGAPTDGSNGPGKAPRWCKDHIGMHMRTWSDDDILDSIRAWARLYGDPPTAESWNPAQARMRHRSDLVDRFYTGGGRWPYSATVITRFGKWSEAIRAAGFEPVSRGQYRNPEDRHRPRPEMRGPHPDRRKIDYALLLKARRDGATVLDISRATGLAETTIRRALRIASEGVE